MKQSAIEGCESLKSQRFECKACSTRFYVPLNPQLGQKDSSVNAVLFRALTNKGIINRLEEVFNVSSALIYDRIRFFYNQCVQFDQWHTSKNINCLKGKTLEVSMDRQHYLANWNNKHDSRPTKLVNTSSVDNKTRFVFASTLNFDVTSDWESIKKDFRKRKDSEKPIHKRRYAQYFISDADVEPDDVGDALALKTPNKHLLIQQTYSLMAHLESMKVYYSAANKVNLFADDDEGFELGICLVLKQLLMQDKLYPVLIRAERNNASQMQDKRAWSEQVLQEHGMSMSEIQNAKLDPEKLRKLSQKYWSAVIHQRNIASGTSKSEWLVHPFPKSRQSIQIKPLKGFSPDITLTIADTLLDVSTHGVDNYFQLIRRRINMLERPITSATNGNRWNEYASYNPKWVMMLIEIFRVYNNYVLTDEKTLRNKGNLKKPLTPAQKLGIANEKYSVEDIINFSAIAKVKK